MRLLRPAVVWPLISGILLAVVLLQTFPILSGEPSPVERPTHTDTIIPEVQASELPRINRQQGPVSYAEAVRLAAPAVVNVYTTKIIEQQSHPLLNDPFFRHYFGRSAPPRQKRMQSSLGSGVIVSAEGYILTNHHVISGADEIRVALRDGREAFATVVGADPDTDMAVLKVDLDDLPVITLASAHDAAIGDVVLAIGNPFGVGQTVTQGIISALGRNSLGINTYENFIQTDAAINPGNSGGALINAYGQLLGINTAIFSRSGGSQGIGFAIPSDLARKIMTDLIDNGYVVRGWLGVEVQDLTPALAQSLQVPNTQGVLIAGLLRGGPAHQAGLLPGDVIVELDGQAVENARQSMNQIASTTPHQRIKIQVLRNGKRLETTVTVQQRPTPTTQ